MPAALAVPAFGAGWLWAAAPAAACALALAGAGARPGLVRRVSGRFGPRGEREGAAVAPRDAAAGFAAYTGAALLAGLAFHVTAVVVSPWPLSRWEEGVLVFSLASLAGYVTPFALSGAGVRESIIVALLGGTLGAPAALTVAVVARATAVLVDAVLLAGAYGAGWLARGLRGATQPPRHRTGARSRRQRRPRSGRGGGDGAGRRARRRRRGPVPPGRRGNQPRAAEAGHIDEAFEAGDEDGEPGGGGFRGGDAEAFRAAGHGDVRRDEEVGAGVQGIEAVRREGAEEAEPGFAAGEGAEPRRLGAFADDGEGDAGRQQRQDVRGEPGGAFPFDEPAGRDEQGPPRGRPRAARCGRVRRAADAGEAAGIDAVQDDTGPEPAAGFDFVGGVAADGDDAPRAEPA
ncbi:hypothetical protein O0235_02870 [Tepidiforma flava]|uniref:Flippase-like domain-containing protein n=1 Tax=Tepidiforma flava TaxID=3004094 RepID=A0ABY7M7K2_9CHLR|nr:hypothetical protein [Tepidiforma flava]WBL36515.1 hypothetical protein O0235_02870 [Tepidiforma flava]